jgi:hypothetical protein
MLQKKINLKPTEIVFLIEKESNTAVPLLCAYFEVEIAMGYADMILHQVYENENEHPLETLFMMPYSDTFTLNKIIVDFRLADGTVRTLETKVTEREAAVAKYTDAITTGQTAVISYTQSR